MLDKFRKEFLEKTSKEIHGEIFEVIYARFSNISFLVIEGNVCGFSLFLEYFKKSL